MNNLDIPQTRSTPAIHADWDAGVLSLRGDSYPENSFALFQPVLDWVEQYLRDTQQHPLRLELELVYLNTSSIRALMDILDQLEEAHHLQRPVSVRWTYAAANERVAGLAEEFKEDCSFPFDIIAKP